MKPTIAFVGWSQAQLRERGNIVPAPRVLDCEALSGGQLRSVSGAVVGDRALECIDPQSLLNSLDGTSTQFCLYALEANRDVRRRWVEAGLAEKFANGDLRARVRDWVKSLPRPLPSPATWLRGRKLDDEMFEMLTHIQDLPKCQTALWADLLGMDRHRLRRACLEKLGLSPDDVIWRWFEYGARVLRRKSNATFDQIAEVYGYSNGGSVRRAFQRRGRPFPPRVVSPTESD